MESTNGTKPVPLHTDKIVCRLDLFPELAQALHDGDLLTGRLFCARLFNLDERRNDVDEVTPTLQATMNDSETNPRSSL